MTAARYAEGAGYALVHDQAALLLPSTVEPAVVARLWSALSDPSSEGHGAVVAVVGVLTDAAGSLPAVPPFVVVSLDAATGSVRAAVRGAGRVVVHASTGPVEVTGADVLLWSERVVAGAGAVDLVLDDGAAAGAASWPLTAGVVRARALHLETLDASSGAAVVPAAVVPAAVVPAAVVPAAVVPAETAEAPSADPDSWPVPGQRSVSAPVAAPDPWPRPTDDEATVLPVPDQPAADGDDVVPAAAEPVEPAEPIAPQVSEDTVLGADDDDYAHLFGDTVFRQVEDAAVRAEETDDDSPVEPAPPRSVGEPAGGAPAAAAARPGPVEPDEDTPDPIVSGVPGSFVPPADRATPGGTPGAASRAAAVQSAADEVEDHDGHTLMSSDVAALWAEAGAPVPTFEDAGRPGANQVLARTCAQGHANPPTRPACRTCGADLDGEPHQAGRPALGRVVITRDGSADPEHAEVVDLERDLVVGRRPRSSTSSADRMPRMITVESPQHDISRSHLKVSLEEWHVLVEDLATTNGTVLLRPGQQPRRLHPNQQELVVEGDVVELGDGVALRFEDIW